MYTLGTAAKATGKSKATISKALKSGRISGSKNGNGIYNIDPAELHRVYPPVGRGEHNDSSDNTPENDENWLKLQDLKVRLETAQQRLADKDNVICDLREDRDQWRRQATVLLEDKRPKSFFRNLFR